LDLVNEKPDNEEHLFMLAMINHRYKKRSDVAVDMLKHCAKMNPARMHECYNNIGAICKEYKNG
ncbi:hypothetical protein, partial [Staphylococcus aureus]